MGVVRRVRSAIGALASDGSGDRSEHIEAQLASIDARLNHWITLLDELNHRLRSIEERMADAAADVEMVAALAVSMDRSAGIAQRATGGEPSPAP